MKILKIAFLATISLNLASCSDDDTATPATTSTEVPAVYKKVYGASSITSDGTYITFKTKNLPISFLIPMYLMTLMTPLSIFLRIILFL